MAFGFRSEVTERRFPSPEEWSFWSRTNWRRAKEAENPEADSMGVVDWAYIGQEILQLLERLENSTIDGQDLRPVLKDEGDIYVDGLGKTGLDISAKSEPWRRGYHACLMGIAKAAENRDGWLRDTTRDITFPPEFVIGPSNPRPKHVPFDAPAAPLEKDCVAAFEPPEKFYMKILTTHGFSSRQRLDAALAYADWLDFKGLSATAEEMYDWGLDIAMGALPEGANNVIDIKTGVIDNKAAHVSSNILSATTALAVHHARQNNLSAALPIFISILRARRQLPQPESFNPKSKPRKQSSFVTILLFFKSLLVTPPYPPEPPTGDEVPTRTPTALCEEAAVMSHIGEILFASSAPSSTTQTSSGVSTGNSVPAIAILDQLKSQQAGLSWTREAVDLAESTLASAETDDVETRERCSECLRSGMDNWSTMVSQMLTNERRKKTPLQEKTGSWFWGGSGRTDMDGEPRWERERKLVDERLQRVQKLLNKEADRKASIGNLLFV